MGALLLIQPISPKLAATIEAAGAASGPGPNRQGESASQKSVHRPLCSQSP